MPDPSCAERIVERAVSRCTSRPPQPHQMEGKLALRTPPQQPQKVYQKPSLKVYGDIRTLTNTTSSTPGNHDSVTGFTKTQ